MLSDNVNRYLYDGEGRLCAYQNVAVAGNYGPMMGYVYGPDGLRVAKGTLATWTCNPATNGFTMTASYVLGPGGEQVSEMAVTGTYGNYSSSWQHTNVFANGSLLATYNGTETYFALGDWLGTKRAEITPDGQSTRFFQLPYGNGLTSIGSLADATEQHFTGKERDPETGEANGNDYFGARYYASTMGRFMSPDWAAKVTPVPYAKLDNPQTLNLYSYVGNNPLSRTDPTGHYLCNGSKDQCAQIKTGLNLAKAAVAKLGANSTGGKAIQKVIDFYGKAGADNGVHVSFGALATNTLGEAWAGANGTVNIKYDLDQINHSDFSQGTFAMSERSGVEVHEGQHGVDDKAAGHGPQTKSELNTTEHNAYRTESYVFQGLGVNSAQGLWSTAWSPANAESNRNAAIEAGAAASVEAVCSTQGCPQ